MASERDPGELVRSQKNPRLKIPSHVIVLFVNHVIALFIGYVTALFFDYVTALLPVT